MVEFFNSYINMLVATPSEVPSSRLLGYILYDMLYNGRKTTEIKESYSRHLSLTVGILRSRWIINSRHKLEILAIVKSEEI